MNCQGFLKEYFFGKYPKHLQSIVAARLYSQFLVYTWMYNFQLVLTKNPSSLRLFAQRSSRPWEAEEISRLASWACLSKLTQINKMSRYAFHSTTLLLTVLHHTYYYIHMTMKLLTCINFLQPFYVAKKSKKELSSVS